jgi:hypothetical protein
MKRRLFKFGPRITLFVLAGAIVNVAVAWACVLSILPKFSEPMVRLADTQRHLSEREIVQMLQAAFHDPRVRDGYGREERRFGWRTVTVSWRDSDTLIWLDKDATSTGWPLYGLQGHFEWDGRRSDGNEGRYYGALMVPEWAKPKQGVRRLVEFVPFVPIWPGFAINTIFYAAILWVLFTAPGSVRRRLRRRRGLCPACAYPVGESAICTECGASVHPSRARQEAVI